MRMVQVQCSFTSTEAIKTLRDWGALDGHLDFHAAPELLKAGLKFNVALHLQRPQGLLGAGSPGKPPRISHSS